VYWANTSEQRWLAVDGCAYRLEKPRSLARRRAEAQAENALRAPMPAQVRLIEAEEGQRLEAGQTVMVLEAMKMEIRLAMPRPAVVQRILVQPGETVAKDQVVVEIGDSLNAPVDKFSKSSH
jgi:biotin carboxyl carrier protein